MTINTADALQALFNNSEDLIVISTPERVRKYVNRAYCNFFKKTETELIGKSFVDEFPEEKKRFYKTFIAQMTPSNPTISTTQPTGDAIKQQLVTWKETGLFDDKGNLLQIVSVGRNVHEVSEIKKQKDELLNMLQAYEKAIDLNMLCSITDKNGTIIHANKQFCNVSKYSKQELIGKNHRIINSGHHSKEFFKNMWNTINRGEMWYGEIKNKAKDGTFYWVDTIIIPMRNSEGKIDKFFSLRMQINEKKALEEEMKNYTSSLEDLLFMVSHQIRTPLTNCMGLLNLLVQDAISEDEYQQTLAYLISSAKELDDYTKKVTNFIESNNELDSTTF